MVRFLRHPVTLKRGGAHFSTATVTLRVVFGVDPTFGVVTASVHMVGVLGAVNFVFAAFSTHPPLTFHVALPFAAGFTNDVTLALRPTFSDTTGFTGAMLGSTPPTASLPCTFKLNV